MSTSRLALRHRVENVSTTCVCRCLQGRASAVVNSARQPTALEALTIGKAWLVTSECAILRVKIRPEFVLRDRSPQNGCGARFGEVQTGGRLSWPTPFASSKPRSMPAMMPETPASVPSMTWGQPMERHERPFCSQPCSYISFLFPFQALPPIPQSRLISKAHRHHLHTK